MLASSTSIKNRWKIGVYWYLLVLCMVIFRSSRKSSGAAPDSSENAVVWLAVAGNLKGKGGIIQYGIALYRMFSIWLIYTIKTSCTKLGQEKLELIIHKNSNLKSGSRRFIYSVRISTPEYVYNSLRGKSMQPRFESSLQRNRLALG